MSSSKKKHMEQGKDKVREKLSHISQQQMAILQQIETLVDKGTSSARDLLDVTNKKHFKHKFVSVMQDLEQCSSRLFLIHASLSADAEEDNESSSDSESSVQTDSQKREKANIRRGPRPKSSSLDEADTKKLNDGNNCSQSKQKEMFVDKKEESTTGEGGTEPSFDLHVKGVSEQAIKRPGVNTAVTEPAPTGTGDKHQATSGATLQPQGRATSPPHKTGEESEFASRSHTSYKEEDGGRVTYTEIETGGLGYEGPQIACLSLEAGVMMDVLVTEVLNPSFFWVQLVNPRLEDLIEQITLTYEKSLSPYSPFEPTVGMVVCARFSSDGQWYRAQVLSLFVHEQGNEKKGEVCKKAGKPMYVEVLFVDFGNKEVLPRDSIKPLTPNFTRLPRQAFPCALSQVGAPGLGDNCMDWSLQHTLAFSQIVLHRELQAVVTQEPDCAVCLVELYYSDRPNPNVGQLRVHGPVTKIMHSVGDVLCGMNFAQMMNNSQICDYLRSQQVAPPQAPHNTQLAASLDHPLMIQSQAPTIVKKEKQEVSPGYHVQEKQKTSKSPGTSKITKDGSRNVTVKVTDKQKLSKSIGALDRKADQSAGGSGSSKAENSQTGSKKKKNKVRAVENQKVKTLEVDVKTVGGATKGSIVAEKPDIMHVSVQEKHKESCPQSQARGGVGNIRARHEPQQPRMSGSTDDWGSEVADETFDEILDKEIAQCGPQHAEPWLAEGGVHGSRPHDQQATPGPSTHSSYPSTATPTTSQQKLKKLGFPSKLPKYCEYSDSFSKWLQDSGESAQAKNVIHQSASGSNRKPAKELAEQRAVVSVPLTSDSGYAECGQHGDSVTSDVMDTQLAGHKDLQTAVTRGPEPVRPNEASVACDLIPETEPVAYSETDTAGYNYEGCDQIQYKQLEVRVEEDCSITFLMSHIDSPGKFFIHLVTESSHMHMDSIMHELNTYYNKGNHTMLRRYFEHDKPMVNDICCAKFKGDNKFYRAQIIDIQVENTKKPIKYKSRVTTQKVTKIKVFYIDFGNCEWIERHRVFPLPPKYADIPPQAVACSLADIKPLAHEEAEQSESPSEGADPAIGEKRTDHDGDKDNKSYKEMGKEDCNKSENRTVADKNSCEWSPDAIKQFTSLTGFTNKLTAFIVGQQPGSVVSPSLAHPLPLIVIDTSREEDIYVNYELVRLGCARSAAFTPVRKTMELAESEGQKDAEDNSWGLTKSWNPMAEDFHSLRNSYAVDIEDPGVATVGYKAQDERRVCKFYSRGVHCFRGENCPFEHVRDHGGITSDKQEVFCVSDIEHTITPPEEGSWVAVEISAVINPSHFYVVFPFGSKPVQELMKEEAVQDEGYEGSVTCGETLEALMDSLRDHYSKKTFRDHDLTVMAAGQLVIAQFTCDNSWCRAKVIDTDPDNERVQVFYVDFGNTEWLPEKRVHPMLSQFVHLPFQALECCLPIDPVSKTRKWSKQVRSYFASLTEGKVLFAHVLSRGYNGVLCVDLYDTDKEEVDITELMIQKGFAQKPEPSMRDDSSSGQSEAAGDQQTHSMLPG